MQHVPKAEGLHSSFNMEHVQMAGLENVGKAGDTRNMSG